MASDEGPDAGGDAGLGRQRPPRYAGLTLAAGVGWVFVANVVAGTVCGLLLDRFLGTKPWGVVGGIGVGSALAYWNLIRLLRRLDSIEKMEKRDEKQ